MQKKLIALAVAGLMSAPAFAQSSVTIYGTLDYGYTFQNRNADTNVGSRSAIDSGISKANRLGFKGVEDLGNGLKVVFVLEAGLGGDDQVWKGNGQARQSYAALAGSFGTVAFGRHYTPQHLFTSAVDPFGKNGLGGAGNVLTQDKRLSNLVAYISPSWGGFSFITAFTNSYDGNESDGNKDNAFDTTNTRVWAFSPSFTNGGLFVAANYHQAKFNEKTGLFDFEHLRVYDLFAAYDFGPVKIGATYGNRTTSFGEIEDVKVRQWLVGATWRITSTDSLLLSYANRHVEGEDIGDDLRLGQVAIGYEHALSKRTALYAQYAHQYQNRAQRDEVNWAPDITNVTGFTAAGVSNDGAFGGSNYRQGFAVGLRHDF